MCKDKYNGFHEHSSESPMEIITITILGTESIMYDLVQHSAFVSKVKALEGKCSVVLDARPGYRTHMPVAYVLVIITYFILGKGRKIANYFSELRTK